MLSKIFRLHKENIKKSSLFMQNYLFFFKYKLHLKILLFFENYKNSMDTYKCISKLYVFVEFEKKKNVLKND